METDEIIKLYLDGKSTTSIAKLANVSPRYIRMLLKENNVEMRPRGSWRRIYTVNEDYFKTWSNNMAYILGFFIADGMVSSNHQMISFSQKEKYILENIRSELDSNHKITKNNSDVYLLNINSKEMKKDLKEIHGIGPNKTSNIKFPYVPKEYMSHFVRGYFDGDGFVKYEKYFISFVGGSKLFMQSLRNVIDEYGFETNFTEHDTYYRVYVSGRKTIKLFSDWMYQNKGLYLRRKYEAFQKETLPLDQLKDRGIKVHKNAIKNRKLERKNCD